MERVPERLAQLARAHATHPPVPLQLRDEMLYARPEG